MIMEGVKEFVYAGSGSERKLITEHSSLLLNGAHICLMVPGENKKLAAYSE